LNRRKREKITVARHLSTVENHHFPRCRPVSGRFDIVENFYKRTKQPERVFSPFFDFFKKLLKSFSVEITSNLIVTGKSNRRENISELEVNNESRRNLPDLWCGLFRDNGFISRCRIFEASCHHCVTDIPDMKRAFKLERLFFASKKCSLIHSQDMIFFIDKIPRSSVPVQFISGRRLIIGRNHHPVYTRGFCRLFRQAPVSPFDRFRVS